MSGRAGRNGRASGLEAWPGGAGEGTVRCGREIGWGRHERVRIAVVFSVAPSRGPWAFDRAAECL
jgi:hypothetical protein